MQKIFFHKFIEHTTKVFLLSIKSIYMKQIFFILFLFCCGVSANAQSAFEVITKKPTSGSVITIEYVPRNTVLQGVKDIEATAYLMEGGLPLAKNILLTKDGGIFRGTVKTNDTTRAVFFSFSKDEIKDNNNEEGYFTTLYDKKDNPVAGSHLAIGGVFSSFGGIWGLKRNVEKGAEYSKKEFAIAGAKEKYHAEYLQFLSQSKEEGDKEKYKEQLAIRAEKKGLGETELLQIKNNYEYVLRDKEKSAAIMAIIKERFPNGTWRRNEASARFYEAKTIVDKEKTFNDYAANYGRLTKNDSLVLESMAGRLATAYADSGKYDVANKYLDRIKSNASKADVLNSIAWKLSGEGVNKKPINAKVGLPMSKLSLDLMNEEKRKMLAKPSYLTAQQYRRNLEGSYQNFADTYATLLYHSGKYEQAYVIEKAAVEFNKRKNTDMNEAFALLTEKVKGPKAAQIELEAFLEDGKYSPAMKEQLKNLYLSAGNTEARWNTYVKDVAERAYRKIKEELTKTMINIPAPQFALKDISGNEVALSSLKGKTVVVDFWATWCGPCIASFPGMQMAVNKFKDNPDVVFLFIDTWENDSNRVKKVTDFIYKNKYNFQVLYDDLKEKDGYEFVVVKNFGVEGIPTKFIIDRNSNIRFKNVGFGGSADALVQELAAMIDIVAAESGTPAKQAF